MTTNTTESTLLPYPETGVATLPTIERAKSNRERNAPTPTAAPAQSQSQHQPYYPDIELTTYTLPITHPPPTRKPSSLHDIPLPSLPHSELPSRRESAVEPSPAPAPIPQEIIETIWNPRINRWRLLTCCTTVLGNGLNDSAAGAVIASIEAHYDIGYATVSTIFLCNALGFIAAAFFINYLVQRIGRAKTLIGAETLLVVGYTTIVATPPFPVVAFSFFLLGLGMATNLTLTQLFLANLANNTPVLGLFHGMYGIGGTVGPLIATSLVSKGLVWSRFYAILLGLAAINAVGLGITFWGYERDHPELEDLLPVLSSSADIPSSSAASAAGAAGEPDRNRNRQRQCAKSVSSGIRSRWRTFHTLLSNPPTTLGSIFIFAYQGAEVAISGWVISFLITFRSGDPSRVGYVTSGFWAGITIGRFTLTFLAHRVGERSFVFFCTAGAMALECLIWLVPSIPGSSVAVALSGLLLGPVYPCGVHILKRLIPRGMQVNSMTLITGVGSSGGAMAPFVTGLLAQKVSLGTAVLHPVCLVLFVVMGGSWWGMPKVGRRDE